MEQRRVKYSGAEWSRGEFENFRTEQGKFFILSRSEGKKYGGKSWN